MIRVIPRLKTWWPQSINKLNRPRGQRLIRFRRCRWVSDVINLFYISFKIAINNVNRVERVAKLSLWQWEPQVHAMDFYRFSKDSLGVVKRNSLWAKPSLFGIPYKATWEAVANPKWNLILPHQDISKLLRCGLVTMEFFKCAIGINH